MELRFILSLKGPRLMHTLHNIVRCLTLKKWSNPQKITTRLKLHNNIVQYVYFIVLKPHRTPPNDFGPRRSQSWTLRFENHQISTWKIILKDYFWFKYHFFHKKEFYFPWYSIYLGYSQQKNVFYNNFKKDICFRILTHPKFWKKFNKIKNTLK